MRILENSEEIFSVLRRHIKKFGNLSNHNPYFLLHYYYTRPESRFFYFDFGNRGGVLVCRDKGLFQILSDPIAPQDAKLGVFFKVCEFVFQKNDAKKLLLEDCQKELKKQVFKNISKIGLRAGRADMLVWPVLSLAEFDVDLAGKKWKRLRYVKNSFFNRKDVDIVEADKVDKKDLEELVHFWRRSRDLKERVYYHQYINAIRGGFAGCDIKKAVLIDRKPVAIIAGWKIPNTDGYYSFMDIHDYRHKNIGEFANLIVLQELKKKGVGYVDFGGGDKKSLIFKMKFQPNRFYKTYSFYISKLQ